ncbi:hypothetical protein FRC08_011715 [Ceratobasidium sp. 394]|nr:hypothetical protein FRC08_011715 [Ceratobasidium sp. 394]
MVFVNWMGHIPLLKHFEQLNLLMGPLGWWKTMQDWLKLIKKHGSTEGSSSSADANAEGEEEEEGQEEEEQEEEEGQEE